MGIKGLVDLLGQEAPNSVSDKSLDSYSGESIAIDTYIWIYDFLHASPLKNTKGEPTGHLKGLLQRTIALLTAGIKPIYVFDGSPPDLKKKYTIAERNAKRKQPAGQISHVSEFKGGAPYDVEAMALHRESSESSSKKPRVGQTTSSSSVPKVPPSVPTQGGAPHFSRQKDADEGKLEASGKQFIKLTREQVCECANLFQLLGIPTLEAPGEAEAQCAQLCKDNLAYAVASGDSDCLPFGVSFLLREMKRKENKKVFREFRLAKVLKELNLLMDEFIDSCIICGCDYCPGIEGMNAKRALQLVRQHKNIENILEAELLQVPPDWQYKQARDLFKNPKTTKEISPTFFSFKPVNKEALIEFLVSNNDFSRDNLLENIETITKFKRAISSQTKLSRFLKIVTKTVQERDE